VNPRHPLIKELKRRIDDAQDDQTTKDLALVLYETATLRSGYGLPDTADFAGRVERMLRLSMNVGLDEKVTSCIDIDRFIIINKICLNHVIIFCVSKYVVLAV